MSVWPMLLIAAAFAQEAPPIVNGETTADYEEVVLLYMEYSGGYAGICTGELVADEWVLTAAHCTSNDGSTRLTAITAYTGPNTNSLEQEAAADDWYPHPSYDGSGYYDIAMVHLADTFRGVPLMAVNKDSLRARDVGEDYRLVGYGITSDTDTSSTSRKRLADVPLYDYDSLLAYFYGDPEGQNACHGDSGGPALEMQADGGYEVAAIVDFAYGSTGDCENNGVATARVDAYIDWIEGYTPVYSYDELYGDADTDTDTDSDTDSDTDTDTDTDSDTDADTDTDAGPSSDLSEDPLRPDNVGEDYSTEGLLSCGCDSNPSGGALAGALLGLLALTARRRS